MKIVRSIFYCVLAVFLTANLFSSCQEVEDGKDGADGAKGSDGKEGSVVTIENCYWQIDGENTGIAACTTDGAPGSVVMVMVAPPAASGAITKCRGRFASLNRINAIGVTANTQTNKFTPPMVKMQVKM